MISHLVSMSGGLASAEAARRVIDRYGHNGVALLFASDSDAMTHEELAQLASRFKKARVVISYYDHQLIRHLYRDWTVVDCTMNKGLHNAGRKGQAGKTAPEILLINGPSFTNQSTAGEPAEETR